MTKMYLTITALRIISSFGIKSNILLFNKHLLIKLYFLI